MGCDSIIFEGVRYGYGINYNNFFDGTGHVIEYFYDGEEYGVDFTKESYEEKPDEVKINGLIPIKKYWKTYLNEFHPKLSLKNLPTFKVVCQQYFGMYETMGNARNTFLVWGHDANVRPTYFWGEPETDSSIALKTESSKEVLSFDYEFPLGSREIIVDFLNRFQLTHCKGIKNPSEAEIQKNRKKLEADIVFGGFGYISGTA